MEETVQALIESASLSKRGKEASRLKVTLSFPVRGHSNLLDFIAEQLQNPVKLTFDAIQARLPDMPDENLTTMMSVDGKDGQRVRRGAKVTGSRNGHIEPHAYNKGDTESNECTVCGRGPLYEAHQKAAATVGDVTVTSDNPELVEALADKLLADVEDDLASYEAAGLTAETEASQAAAETARSK